MPDAIKYQLGLDNSDFVSGMRQAQREVAELSKQSKTGNLGSLSGELQLASGSASEFSAKSKGAGSSLKSLISDFRAGTGATAGLTAGLGGATVVIGGFAVAVASAKAVLQDYAPYDSAVRGLAAIEGGSAQTSARLERMRKVAELPGLGFEEAIKGDVRLRSVGLTADLSERSLRAVGNAIALVGGGKAELDGVSVALMQISAKGTVAAEEINQIAERMPQVRQAMKDAFGTADTEKIQKMGLSSAQFIERLVTQLEKLPKATGGAQNTIENFDQAWSDLKHTAEEFIVDSSSGLLNYLAGSMQQARRELGKLQEAFGIRPANLEGGNVSAAIEERKRKREEEAETARQVAAQIREVEEANLAYQQRLTEEYLAEQARKKKKQAEEDEANAKRIADAQNRVFAASLDEKVNIQRQIDRLALEDANKPLVNRGSVAERNAARRAERAEARAARRNAAGYSNGEDSFRSRYDRMSPSDKAKAGSYEDWRRSMGVDGTRDKMRDATRGARDAASPAKTIDRNMDAMSRKLDGIAAINRKLENLGIAA
ncbi:MAG: tape measure protein [Luteolibacter sp.]